MFILHSPPQTGINVQLDLCCIVLPVCYTHRAYTCTSLTFSLLSYFLPSTTLPQGRRKVIKSVGGCKLDGGGGRNRPKMLFLLLVQGEESGGGGVANDNSGPHF